jgi:integrase
MLPLRASARQCVEALFIQPLLRGTRLFIPIVLAVLCGMRRGEIAAPRATHMLSSGVHPKVANERLGHTKIGITLDLHSHVLPNMQADAAAIVDGALRAALNKRETKG